MGSRRNDLVNFMEPQRFQLSLIRNTVISVSYVAYVLLYLSLPIELHVAQSLYYITW